MLSKSERLCTIKLPTLDASQTTFTGINVTLVAHLHIILGVAAGFVFFIKGAVPSVQNVDLWVGQSGV